MKYKGIRNVESTFKKSQTLTKKSLHFFACIFLSLLVCSCYNISLIDALGLNKYIAKVMANWNPKTEDFGKIKFVHFSFNSKDSDGVFIVNSPFKNYYVTNISDTILSVNGLGDVVVISPIDGRILDVKITEGKCDISIINSNVIVNIMGLDYACVSVGQDIKTADNIAVCLDSVLQFSIVCNGEYIPLPASGSGDTFFE